MNRANRLKKLGAPPFPCRYQDEDQLYRDGSARALQLRKSLDCLLTLHALWNWETGGLRTFQDNPCRGADGSHIQASAVVVIELDALTSPLSRRDLIDFLSIGEPEEASIRVGDVIPKLEGTPHAVKDLSTFLAEPFPSFYKLEDPYQIDRVGEQDFLYNLKPAWRLWTDEGAEQVGFFLCTSKHSPSQLALFTTDEWRSGISRMSRKLADDLGGVLLEEGDIVDPIKYAGVVRFFQVEPISLNDLYFPDVFEISPKKRWGTSRRRGSIDDAWGYNHWDDYVNANTWVKVRKMYESLQQNGYKDPGNGIVSFEEIHEIAGKYCQEFFDQRSLSGFDGSFSTSKYEPKLRGLASRIHAAQSEPSVSYRRSVALAKKGGQKVSDAKTASSRANLTRGRESIKMRNVRRSKEIHELRIDLGYAVEDIAAELGLSARTVYRYLARAERSFGP